MAKKEAVKIRPTKFEYNKYAKKERLIATRVNPAVHDELKRMVTDWPGYYGRPTVAKLIDCALADFVTRTQVCRLEYDKNFAERLAAEGRRRV